MQPKNQNERDEIKYINPDKIIDDIASLIQYMNKNGVYDQYLTAAGQAFLDGFLSSNGSKLELVRKERYKELAEKYDHLLIEFEKLKNKKRKFLGLF